MLEFLHWTRQDNKEKKDTKGFLTKEEAEKLRAAKLRNRNPQRKTSYKTWSCNACRHEYFYKVLRCPACESDKIEETRRPTRYDQGHLEEEDDAEDFSTSTPAHLQTES